MTLRLKLISWLTSPLLLTLIPSLLPIPSYLLSTTAQAQTSQNRKTQASKLLQQGLQQFELSQYQAAIESWQKALEIYQQLKDRTGEGLSLTGLAEIYFHMEQYPKAIELYQQSSAIFKEIGDYREELRQRNRQGEGESLRHLGIVYENLGQYPKAIELYQQSLSIFREIGNRQGEGKSLMDLGSPYRNLGQYLKAIEFYQQSLSIFREIGNQQGEGLSLIGIGNAYGNLGQYPKAIEFFQQSLNISRDIGNRYGEGLSLMNLGNAYSLLRQYPKAIEFYQQSLAIQQDIGDRNEVAKSMNNLGNAYGNLGQYPKAIEFFQQCLSISRAIGNIVVEGLTFHNIGSTLQKQQQSELAIVFYKQSVNVREGIRQDLRKLPREQQASYTQTVADSYRRLASLLLEKNRVMEALQVLDLLKVQELQDYVRNVQNDKNKEKIELFPQEQKIIQDYTAIQAPVIRLGAELADLRKLQTRTPTQQQRIQEIEKIQAKTNQQMSEFLKSPAVVALSQQMQKNAPQQNLTLSAYKDLQTRLNRLGKRIALFYTLVLDDRLELVLLPPGKPPIRRSVAIKRTELEKMIQTFRQDLQDPNSQVKETAQKLYSQLIKPIESELQQADVQSIIYAPDGQMRYIPLAALYDGKKWLTERYQINYLTALALTKLEPESTHDPRVLAGAFTQGNYSLEAAGQTFNFQGLRFAKTEVEGLGAATPNTTKLFDKAFNRDAILSKIKNYSIVHMATHAVFVKGAPENSFILMGDGNRINLKEIEEWKLPDVTLVVLSACQTALGGELGNGLEILGFGYQLQRTGVRASIASLWEVSDGGTKTLMDALYERLKSGKMTKAEALHEAQISLITGKNQSSGETRSSVRLTPGNSGQTGNSAAISRNLSHPYYWSPFILIGNGL
ncbi:CHAT domain-containing protein [Dolichospermum flos-aquae]|uniref:CHAT domain-containing protein n=1 Tax=Dolichospermum flos-aquae CCAP 1403/13F TaxID=315271 RepID=A0A6H2BWW4_DOLFA|nr:tetratricopeptide repeat protein [Dolichospermum flos-aquae]QJB43456.1 CHAT domain-containing protein [Dolichospermum flos-aquae CCAP 1403/13F]